MAMDDWPTPEPVELPEGIHDLIKPELQPGERLLWAGRGSIRPRIVYPSNPSMNPLAAALLAAGFFIIGELCLAGYFGAFGRGFDEKDSGKLLLFGLIGTIGGSLGGVGMIGGWLSRSSERTKAAQSLYALTDRRVIIRKPRRGTDAVEVYTSPRGKIRDVHRVEYSDGSGDVICGVSEEMWWGACCNLEGVAEVRRVEELVRRFLTAPDPEAGVQGGPV